MQNTIGEVEKVDQENTTKLQQILEAFKDCEDCYLNKLKKVIFCFLHENLSVSAGRVLHNLKQPKIICSQSALARKKCITKMDSRKE